MDINIDALYNILKQNQGDVNDAMGLKKKTDVVTSGPLALIAEKTKVSKRKEKVIVSLDSEGSDADDFSELKKINDLLAKAFNRRKDYEYYKTKMLLATKDEDEQVLLTKDQAWMESSSDSDQEINTNMVFMAQIEKVLSDSETSSSSADDKIYEIADQEVLYDKMSVQLVELDKHVRDLKNTVLEKELKIFELEKCVRNKTVYMIMPSKDTLYNGRKGIGFENPSYFEKAKDLRPIIYNEKVIGLGYTMMFLTHSDEALKIEKFKRERENKIEFAYDYGNMNASFESSENEISQSKNQSENDCQVVEKECDQVDNSKVIALGMFKLSVSQSVSPISVTKTFCASKNVENLDTFSNVRRPKHSDVIWKKKMSSNTSNVDLSSVSYLKLNKDVKRYSRKDLLSCNNSHLGETSSAYVCNDAINVSCNSRLCDSFDENNLFIFDDENVRISSVSKMPFRKKPRDYMNVCSKSNLNKFLPRIVHTWLPKMQLLAEPVAKWIPRIVQICLWIIDSGCSKHMTGNRALLINFMEKFLGTVRFGINYFAVIAGYGDVVIGSMTIKKVYYVEGLGHNLFSVGQFCKKGLEVAFRKSTCFVRNEDGVDLLTGDRSSNLYTIALNEVVLNSSTCLLEKASSLQSWLWHQRLSHLNFATINNLVKNNLVQALDVIISFIKKTQVNLQLQVQRVRTDNGTEFKNKTLAKFFDEVGITQQYSAARTPQQNCVVERRNRTLVEAARTMLTFTNLPLFLWAEAIATTCFTQNHSIIHKRFDKTLYEIMNKRKPNIKLFRVFGCRCYLLNDYEDVGKLKAKGDIGVFVGYSKESAAFRIYNKQTLSQASETSKKDLEDLFQNFYDEYFDASKIMKSSTSNVETSINDEVFHETKDHPLHKIIGDPKSSVRTRGQLANSCLFSCLLSSIEPVNVVEALRDADWVSAMQEELDQFTRLKVWRLVPRPEGKIISKTKWIFKNKKDESSLVIRNKARLVAVGYSQQ
nr:hypothetical protein [Tanacetum cinerariifolium]